MIDGGEIISKSESTSKLQKCIETERYEIDHLFKDALFWYDDNDNVDEYKWKLIVKKRKQIFKLKFKLLKLYDKIFKKNNIINGRRYLIK